MAILSFHQVLSSPPRNKIYVADTCFLIEARQDGSDSNKVAKKLAAANCGLVFNVTIHNEILHYTRELLVDRAFDEEPEYLGKSLIARWKRLEDVNFTAAQKMKAICDSGHFGVFRKIFGEKGEVLAAEKANFLCLGKYFENTAIKQALKWEMVPTLMAQYGLDSSDAMIVNFAVNCGFDGIVSTDKDYRIAGVGEDNSFEVILPSAAVKLPIKPVID